MPFKSNLPAWTSLLYLPADTAVASAQPMGCRPDAVVLDLEDFVAQRNKATARARIKDLAAAFTQCGIAAVVRINRPLAMAMQDLDQAIGNDVKALMVTKVASAQHLSLLDEAVAELEMRRGLPVGHTQFVAMIETSQGLANIEDIASSVDRLVAMVLGGEDLARECGMRPSRLTLAYPKQKLVHAAAAAGILPWGYLASVAESSDRTAFHAMVADSREFGFVAATCLQPMQVCVVKEVYAPSPAEVQRARALLADPSSVHPHPVNAEDITRAEHTLARAGCQEVPA
jgi:citrate lyase subunit beta/citryl-CoA lyase